MQATLYRPGLRQFLEKVDFPVKAGGLLTQARKLRADRRTEELIAMLKPDLTLNSQQEALAEVETLDVLESERCEVNQDPYEFEED